QDTDERACAGGRAPARAAPGAAAVDRRLRATRRRCRRRRLPRNRAVCDRRRADCRRRLDRTVKALGLDLGATNLKLVLLEDERVVVTDQAPTRSEDGGPDAVFERI